jgi:D-inositol-3-phosphate glycosyltransferase
MLPLSEQPVWLICRHRERNTSSAPRSFFERVKFLYREYSTKSTSEYGAQIAQGAFNAAMMRHLSYPLALLSDRYNVEHLGLRNLNSVQPDTQPERRAFTWKQFPFALKQQQCRAWIDATGSLATPFTIRSLFSGNIYPILFTHHTLSYPHLAYQDFMPLVLARSYPFDTFVCTSQDASIQAQRILARVSDDLEASLGVRREFRGRFAVIPFGIDTNVFYPLDVNKCRSQLRLDKHAFTILAVGRVSPVDKADLIPFLRHAKELSLRIGPRKLSILIAGGSHHGYQEILKEYIKEAGLTSIVKLLDRVPYRDLPALYCSADVFVALSDNIQECLGLSALEAMASGVPQVVADWSGFKDTVKDGVTGFRIPTYWTKTDDEIGLQAAVDLQSWPAHHFALAQTVALDIRILLDRLSTLALNPSLRNEMASASLFRARTVYDWKVIVKSYEELLESTILEASTHTILPKDHHGRVPFGDPQYFDNSAHFASRIITETTILEPSSIQGSRAPQESLSYATHFRSFDRSFLDDPQRLVQACGVAATFAEYQAHLRRSIGCSQTEAKEHVMWLLKYGFLAIHNN